MSETTSYTQNGSTQRARELVEKYGQPRVFVIDPAALEPLLEDIATSTAQVQGADGQDDVIVTGDANLISALVGLASEYESAEKAIKAQRERITAALAAFADQVPEGFEGASVLQAHGAPVFRVTHTPTTTLNQAAVKKVFPVDEADSAPFYTTSIRTARTYVR